MPTWCPLLHQNVTLGQALWNGWVNLNSSSSPAFLTPFFSFLVFCHNFLEWPTLQQEGPGHCASSPSLAGRAASLTRERPETPPCDKHRTKATHGLSHTSR